MSIVLTGRAKNRAAGATALALALAVVTLPTATAGNSAKKPPKAQDVKVQILSFNDYHGWLEDPSDNVLGAALDPTNTPVGGGRYLASQLTALRGGFDGPSLTVAAGDLIGGSPFLSGAFHDEPSVESLNAMGLDVSSVGNHEFDEGVTELFRMQDGGCHPIDGCYFPGTPFVGAEFSWLAANTTYKAGHPDAGETVLPGTWVKTVNGVKVGFIGMTLESTPELVSQAGIEDVVFGDEVETANAAAKVLKGQGVKAIVVLLHEGGTQSGTYGECTGISGPIVAIAENLHPEIDMVVTGHTHQPYVCNIPDSEGQPRMVTSASSFGRVVTESYLTINPSSGQVKRALTTSVNHLVPRTLPVDATQQAILDKWKVLEAPIGNQVIGQITAQARRSPNRDTESNLANLIADAQLAATSGAATGGAQLALMNPGGVRADLGCTASVTCTYPRNATFREMFNIQPFSNTLLTKTYTGAQVDAILEQQFIASRGRQKLILGVSTGLTFTWTEANAEGNKVSNIVLNGTPLDPAANYRVAHNQFLTTGGDGFTGFIPGTGSVGGGNDLDAFIAYVGANSPLTPPTEDRILGS